MVKVISYPSNKGPLNTVGRNDLYSTWTFSIPHVPERVHRPNQISQLVDVALFKDEAQQEIGISG